MTNAVLLTWNPGPDDDFVWTPDDWDDLAEAVEEQEELEEQQWSVGRRANGIEPGDEIYFLRQGAHGRGVVGRGKVVKGIYDGDDWRETGGSAKYIAFKWTEVLALDDMITVEELEAVIPEYGWRTIYGSGRDVTAYAARLADLFDERFAPLDLYRNPVTEDDVQLERALLEELGAGFGTPESNREVEQAAIRFVSSTLEQAGYRVTSVEQKKCGWDLTAHGDGEERHIEVKGVKGPLVRVLLTANELVQAGRDLRWELAAVTNALSSNPQWWDIPLEVVQGARPITFDLSLKDNSVAQLVTVENDRSTGPDAAPTEG